MVNEIIDGFLYMLKDWPVGTILAVMLGITCIVCLAVLAYGFFLLLDSICLAQIRGFGTIVDKVFTPKHDEIYYMLAGKVLVPMKTRVDDSFELAIKTQDGVGSVSVTRSYFN